MQEAVQLLHENLSIKFERKGLGTEFLKLIIILPYLGKMSQIVKTRLTKTMNKHIKFCKFRVTFQTNNRLKNYLGFKYFVPEILLSSLIYKFTCGSCTASYIGKTYRQLKVRVSDYQGVSPRTDKSVKGALSTSVMDSILVCDHELYYIK